MIIVGWEKEWSSSANVASTRSIGSIDSRPPKSTTIVRSRGFTDFSLRFLTFCELSATKKWARDVNPPINEAGDRNDAKSSFCKHLVSWTINWCYVVIFCSDALTRTINFLSLLHRNPTAEIRRRWMWSIRQSSQGHNSIIDGNILELIQSICEPAATVANMVASPHAVKLVKPNANIDPSVLVIGVRQVNSCVNMQIFN